ncbi:MAG: hypothetical protein M4579_001172 [Chaenotheca gracillima]|nr:MAG: hypothetical protein M4579_001172 [Chaenotheca gracillima]
MDTTQADTEDEFANCKPVVIITNEYLEARIKKMTALQPTGPDVWVSPLSDESVRGYETDKQPTNGGVQNIYKVVKILEDAGVSCCMVGEPALIYYGTGRVKMEWYVCVPAELVEKAADLIRAHPDVFEPFRPSKMSRNRGMEHLYPRFKFVGISLFFILMSSRAFNLPCQPDKIEYSSNGIPYPQLAAYAQSLLDTYNLVDLDDLVDGMNLTLEWGEENLDLEGTMDAEWGRWKAYALHGHDADADRIPQWCSRPPKRRDTWAKTVSAESKKNRQGFKYSPVYETRFWRRGRKDPRLRPRANC